MNSSICLFRLLSNTMFTQEWDKFKVAFVLQGKPHFVEEDDKVINTKVIPAFAAFCPSLTDIFSPQEFRGMALQSHGPQQAGRPWIGLEHTNKVSSGITK